MNLTWTPTATQSLQRFLDEIRQRNVAAGVDAEEVTSDLRRHVEEDLASSGISLVTEADVQRVIARVRPVPEEPALPGARGVPPAPADEAPNRRAPSQRKRILSLILGVALPLITLLVEVFGRPCARELFDPLPTVWHVALAFTVPLANLAGLIWLQRREARAPAWLWYSNAFAAGVATFYMVLFLPVLPFAAIGILVFGLGLLPLAPLFALVDALRLRGWMRRRGGDSAGALPKGWVWVFLAPLVGLAGYGAPSFATRHYAQVAVSDAAGATNAVRWLRRWGDTDQLLRDCYGQRRGPMMEFLSRPVSEAQSRELFFRVTGQPFNAVKPPASLHARRNRFALDEWAFAGDEWDGALGGEAVAGRVRGLSLISSRLDGILGADEATTYTEWTLEFRNDHERTDREARAQILLPPGGVVSRLTLWVHGEEREAAFAGRAETRTAYQQVAVVQRRDPVLVSTCGPDRILVQCFPVPAKGGRLKVRLGITAPLHLLDLEDGVLQWPQIIERNFGLGANLTHSVWLEASQPLASVSTKLHPDTQKPGRPGLHGLLSDSELADPSNAVRLKRNPAIQLAWALDEGSKDGAIVRQRFQSSPAELPSRIAVVIDGSASMNGEFSAIAEALAALPSQAELAAFVAEDSVRAVSGNELRADRLGMIRSLRGVGGQDNVLALCEAWDWAAERPGGVVLWVHGPQPVLLSGVASLRQRLEWRPGPGAPRVHDLQTRPGPNRVVEQLAGADRWQVEPRLGTLGADLDRLVRGWTSTAPKVSVRRERSTGGPNAEDRAAKHGSSHLVRLWAADEVERLVRAKQLADAARLGAQHQLVTSASGAVVLETRQQYEQSGLQPVNPATVPVVPEPGTVALLVIGGACLLLWKQKLAAKKPADTR